MNADAAGFRSIAGGVSSVVSGDDSISIGTSSDATSNRTVALGTLAQATGLEATSLGDRSIASASDSIAIGSATIALGIGSIAIGGDGADGDTLAADQAVALGADAVASYASTLAFGATTSATGALSIAIGGMVAMAMRLVRGLSLRRLWRWARITRQPALAVPRLALARGLTGSMRLRLATQLLLSVMRAQRSVLASGTNTAAVGRSAIASGSGATAVGTSANASQFRSVAIGGGSQSSASQAVAIGSSANATFADSVAIGTNAATTAANQVTLGGTGSAVRIGDIDASTAAQQGPVDAVTVDANGVLGKQQVATAASVDNVRVALNSVAQVSTAQFDALSGRVNALDFRLEELDESTRGGIAAAMAFGGTMIVPDSKVLVSLNASTHQGERGFAAFPSEAGKTSYASNVATYRGEVGFSAGLMHRCEGDFAITAGVTYAGGNSTSLRAGIAGEF